MVSPAVVFVHDASFSAWSFSAVISPPWEHGITAVARELPTSLGDPTATAADEISLIRQIVNGLLEGDCARDIVMFGHSYGGTILGSALSGLIKAQRESQGLRGGVVGAIYASTLILSPEDQGKTFQGVQGGYSPDKWCSPEDYAATNVSICDFFTITNGSPLFFNTLGPDASEIYNPLLRPLSIQAFTTPFNATSHDSNGGFVVPTKYIHTLKDKSVPVWVLEEVINRAKNRSNYLGEIVFDAGHMFPLQNPERTASEVEAFIREVSI